MSDALAANPVGDRVLVKKIEDEQKPQGGLIMPDSSQNKFVQGEVIATGEGVKIRLDSRVLFDKSVGQEIRVFGRDYLIMHEKDIAVEIVDATTVDGD